MSLRRIAPGLVAIALAAAPSSGTAGISSGAFEFGVNGSLTSASGTTTASIALRAAHYVAVRGGWVAPGTDLAYLHVREHDAFDALANLTWTVPLANRAVYPFVAATAGVRQAWQGSFREARYPVGASVGVRAFVGANAVLLLEYRALRITGDPVADFSEHHVRIGASVFR